MWDLDVINKLSGIMDEVGVVIQKNRRVDVISD